MSSELTNSEKVSDSQHTRLSSELEQRVVERTAELASLSHKLQKALEEKDQLMREIQHRVKNNLQVILSLLAMQARCVEDAEALAVLERTRSRIFSMSLIHEMLYETADYSRLDFGAYLKNLATNLVTLSSRNPDAGITVNVKPLYVLMEQAVPLGLIANELITNALLHCTSEKGKENVSLTLESDSETVVLRVHNDGPGLPAAFDELKQKHFGLRLVGLLSVQLKAAFEIGTRSDSTGVTATLRLPFQTFSE